MALLLVLGENEPEVCQFGKMAGLYKRDGHKPAFSKEMRPETRENVERFYSLAVYCWLAFETWRHPDTLITRRSFSSCQIEVSQRPQKMYCSQGAGRREPSKLSPFVFLRPVCLVMSCCFQGPGSAASPPPQPLHGEGRGPGAL